MTSPVRAPRPTPRRTAPAAPAPRRGAHLHVVPPPGRPGVRPRRTPAVLVVATVLVFGSLLTSAMFHGMLVSGQSRLDRLDAQLQDERAALAREKLDLAHLQSPARIAAAAEKMGMVRADGQTWLSPGTDAPPVVTGATVADPTTSDLAAPDGGGDAQ